MRPSSITELPGTLAIFPLAGVLLLPFGQLPLNIFEPRYLAMTRDALGGERLIGMIQPADPRHPDANPPLYRLGCAGRITAFAETEDNRFLITLTGLCRFAVSEELALKDGYRRVRADWTAFADDLRVPEPGSVPEKRLKTALKAYLSAQRIDADWKSIETASGDQLVTSLAMACPFAPSEKQALLESPRLVDRAELMISLMAMSVLDGDSGERLAN